MIVNVLDIIFNDVWIDIDIAGRFTMESGDLRIFQCVAQEGSLTRAAARLGYVQSNVTARIRHLESEVGTLLFIRHNRG